MSDTRARIALRARLVFPIASPPIDGGVITIQGDRIVAVGENQSSAPPVDLGDVALLPGLVNPHTHLEFSELPGPLGESGMSLPQWISAVVLRRREAVDKPEAVLSAARRSAAVRRGMRQCLRSGTTTVGDIAAWDVTDDIPWSATIRCFGFREVIGLTDSQIVTQMEGACQYLAQAKESSTPLTCAVSPHAPYTVAPELVRQIAKLSRKQQLNVAMHLGESPEELRLLARGDGPFRELLQRFGLWDDAVFSHGRRPLDYLQMLSAAHRCLVIHGNFLGPDDWALLANHRATMSLVYCCRTHSYFGHPPYPLSRLLRQGVRVALGTDGLASNPDLNLFEELRFAARRHTDVRPSDLLRMVTLDAAESLGCSDRVGSLESGKLADLAVVSLTSGFAGRQDPVAALLDDGVQVCGVWIGGVEVIA